MNNIDIVRSIYKQEDKILKIYYKYNTQHIIKISKNNLIIFIINKFISFKPLDLGVSYDIGFFNKSIKNKTGSFTYSELMIYMSKALSHDVKVKTILDQLFLIFLIGYCDNLKNLNFKKVLNTEEHLKNIVENSNLIFDNFIKNLSKFFKMMSKHEIIIKIQDEV